MAKKQRLKFKTEADYDKVCLEVKNKAVGANASFSVTFFETTPEEVLRYYTNKFIGKKIFKWVSGRRIMVNKDKCVLVVSKVNSKRIVADNIESRIKSNFRTRTVYTDYYEIKDHFFSG